MQLHRARHEIEEAGARLVVIGNGAPNFVAGFRERTGFAGTIYTDPERNTYRALKLKRGVRTSVNRKTVARAVKAFRAGNRQVGTQGDPWQQGGVFVVAAGGALVYEQRSEYAGDHPPVEEIIEAARAAADASPPAATAEREPNAEHGN